MHAIQTLFARPETERLGWVLLHFVWQGAVIAALCAIAFVTLRRASANVRYLIACSGLLVMAACLPVSWFVVAGPAPGGTGRQSLPVQTGSEAAESRGRVSPRLDLRVSERRDYAPDHTFEKSHSEFAGSQSLFSPSPLTGEGRGEGVAQQTTTPPPFAAAWLDRIAAALPWLVVAWLIGVFSLSIRLAIGWQGIHRLRRAPSLPADGPWQSVLLRLCDRLRLRFPVKLLESSLVDVPTMIGWLRPAILWPPALLVGLSVEQFEALLAHELAHVRRHDYLANLIQTAIETLLFYHPAVWWLSRRIRHERECCCDDLAVAACGNRLSYARALATLEELRPSARQLVLAADGGRLLARIRRIIGLPTPRREKSRHWLLGLTLSATLLVAGIAVGLVNLATGDEPAKASVDPPASNAATDADPTKPPDEQCCSCKRAASPTCDTWMRTWPTASRRFRT
jgi:bla regulator protein blaR1